MIIIWKKRKSAYEDKFVNTTGKEEGWNLLGIITISCLGAGLPLPSLCGICGSSVLNKLLLALGAVMKM